MRRLPADHGPLAVKDLVFEGIVPLATCGRCGRQRIIHGGLLPRSFSPETRLNAALLAELGRRLRCGACGACGARGATLELVFED